MTSGLAVGSARAQGDLSSRAERPWSSRPSAAASNDRAMRVLLVDPSLFSGPYDAALNEGLLAAGVRPRWAVRSTRPGDRVELSADCVEVLFYRHVDTLLQLPDGMRRAVKGLAHVAGLARLLQRIAVSRPDVVHFQWTVFPPLDATAMLAIRRRCAVVVTVHDSTPGNGNGPWLYRSGQQWPMRLAHRLIVHTKAARQALVVRGIAAETIEVIPHGPLRLHVPLPERSDEQRDPRYTIVLFGELKAYKGIDILIDAIALLPDRVRRELRVIVAGRPQMDLAPLLARVRELGLDGVFELRPGRLGEEAMAELFASADCFVFPYRVVDASGVYFLVRSLSRWIIASRVGVFAEQLTDGVNGELVPVENPPALAAAIERATTGRAKPKSVPGEDDWTAIGRATLALYRAALSSRVGSGDPPCDSQE